VKAIAIHHGIRKHTMNTSRKRAMGAMHEVLESVYSLAEDCAIPEQMMIEIGKRMKVVVEEIDNLASIPRDSLVANASFFVLRPEALIDFLFGDVDLIDSMLRDAIPVLPEVASDLTKLTFLTQVLRLRHAWRQHENDTQQQDSELLKREELRTQIYAIIHELCSFYPPCTSYARAKPINHVEVELIDSQHIHQTHDRVHLLYSLDEMFGIDFANSLLRVMVKRLHGLRPEAVARVQDAIFTLTMAHKGFGIIARYHLSEFIRSNQGMSMFKFMNSRIPGGFNASMSMTDPATSAVRVQAVMAMQWARKMISLDITFVFDLLGFASPSVLAILNGRSRSRNHALMNADCELKLEIKLREYAAEKYASFMKNEGPDENNGCQTGLDKNPAWMAIVGGVRDARARRRPACTIPTCDQDVD
jgi:hypothetical protein